MPDASAGDPGRHSSSSDTELAHTVALTCTTIEPAFANGTGASRDQLLWTAMNEWASATTVALLLRLPTRYYLSIDEVRTELAESLSV